MVSRFQPPSRRGPGRPPDVDGDDTKTEIRNAARHLFGQHGYFATTTRMIALEVGVTPAALHHYYGRKRDLALSVWRSTTEAEYERVFTAVEAKDTFIGKVHELLDTAHDSRRRDLDVSTFIASMTEGARRTAELHEILEDTRPAELVRSIVEFGVQTGAVEEENAAAMRGAIGAVLLGATLLGTDLTWRRIDATFDGCKRLFDGTLYRAS